MAYTDIDDPSAYFQTKTYTGSAGAQSITFDGNSDLQPDWIWIKERGAVAGHVATDTVRGISASSAPFLQPSATGAEINANGTVANRTLTSSNTNGFTLGQDAYYTNFNNNSDTYVSWNWKAGGSASSNTDGSITSSVSANTTAGFSIVSFTGTGSALTAGHGLGVKPSMIIAKSTTIANNWIVQHGSLGATNTIFLDNTNPSQTGTSFWNDTEPTSSVFSLGNWSGINTSGSGIIAYCFAEKKGFSKFGSYTGNGNANGTFVYTGFKPAFVIIKSTDLVKNWLTFDNLRLGYNGTGTNKQLHPNTTGAETSGNGTTLDILSNGFKTRTTDSDENGSGNSYIFMAFAESPFTNSSFVPNNAR